MGLSQEQLSKEEGLALKSIDSVKEVLGSFDMRLIHQILLEILKKTRRGLYQNVNLEFLLPENISITVKYEQHADLDTDDTIGKDRDLPRGGITMLDSVTLFARGLVDEKGEVPHNSKKDLLHALVHELIHGIGTSFSRFETTDTWIPRTGFIELFKLAGQDKVYLDSLNEAFTEIIADAVVSEYLARSGTLKEYEEKQGKDKTFFNRTISYLPERILLSSFVSALAEKLQVGEGVIYQGMATEYFSTGSIATPEMLEVFKEDEKLADVYEKLKHNDVSEYESLTEGQEVSILNTLDLGQLQHVTALVGRDYIGSVNKSRVLRPSWSQRLTSFFKKRKF